ncbi:DEAD/DEAH box helicase [uncultured Desulfovibrio sp.]|uniref:type I-G CRISPR-associated helicase/endonuclease Cas3g n=1 Tax=uncultured Desulfovibrio sp. TaxID=167968 RepID=UPI002605E305|nr:DEAD/DEAH box helicase [uncultured Desulfovibrio sp.]
MTADLLSLYKAALGVEPYPYQQRLAEWSWPDLLEIPTGLGKTAAIYLAWLRKRLEGDAGTPRRLVWCLPMRVLVEQTAALARRWGQSLQEAGLLRRAPAVHVLMGGQVEQEWDSSPEDEAVLVGTQDQLLSRALNRGYAMSRYRWPLDFALLHNDCLWVFDEVQLMGAGLTTSAQLDAFRSRFGVFAPCRSLWCSAPLQPQRPARVDAAPRLPGLAHAGLEDDDRAFPRVRQRLEAAKALAPLDAAALTSTVLETHRPGTLTLVIRNTVKDAVASWDAITRARPGVPVTLLHSRFRPLERRERLAEVLAAPDGPGRIVVTTQVVEAGVDISAATLFTDMAPWPSLVQRFGRCNRAGEITGARIFWLDGDITDRSAAPYEAEDVSAARDILRGLDDGCPSHLPAPDARRPEHPVPRAVDMLDLFDTTPDLAGADVDISRFIRDSDSSDAQVFWRELSEGRPAADIPAPHRDELCPVPLHELSAMAKKGGRTFWRWDALAGEWTEVRLPRPGMVLLLDAAQGGYDCLRGWDAKGRKAVPVAPSPLPRAVAMNSDVRSLCALQTLESHAAATEDALCRLTEALNIPSLAPVLPVLRRAARLHDCGKAHPVFQQACMDAPDGDFWAKTPRMAAYGRPGFRHELASALALRAAREEDLATYLAAAHLGKVRLSIRSLPGEAVPEDGRRFARGVWEGDELPATSLLPATQLSLAVMELGVSAQGASWADRMERLLEQWGPFRLAFLESLVRLADWRASAAAEEDGHA